MRFFAVSSSSDGLEPCPLPFVACFSISIFDRSRRAVAVGCFFPFSASDGIPPRPLNIPNRPLLVALLPPLLLLPTLLPTLPQSLLPSLACQCCFLLPLLLLLSAFFFFFPAAVVFDECFQTYGSISPVGFLQVIDFFFFFFPVVVTVVVVVVVAVVGSVLCCCNDSVPPPLPPLPPLPPPPPPLILRPPLRKLPLLENHHCTSRPLPRWIAFCFVFCFAFCPFFCPFYFCVERSLFFPVVLFSV